MCKSLQTYQHLLGQVLKQQLLAELESFDTEASKIIKEALEKENQNGRRNEQLKLILTDDIINSIQTGTQAALHMF